MVNVIVVVYTDNLKNKGLRRLSNSADKYGWTLSVIHEPWAGWAHRLRSTVDRMKELSIDYDYAINMDAFDTLFLRPVKDLTPPQCPLLLSAETNCWPKKDRQWRYPLSDSPWKYCNSNFIIDLKRLDLLEVERLPAVHDDQLWITDLYLKQIESGKQDIQLDTNCDYFQTLAFCHPWSEYFDLTEGFRNRITNTKPYFLHSNGKTDYSWAPGY